MKMTKGLCCLRNWGCAKNAMENQIIRLVIVVLIVAAIGIIYLSTQKTDTTSSENVIKQGFSPELRNVQDFAWFKHWDQLYLAVVKRYYQRYTVAEMRILWNEKLFISSEHTDVFVTFTLSSQKL